MGQRLDNARNLYLEAIRDGDAAEAIAKYSGDRYVQHSTPVADGQDGFVEFFTGFLTRNPEREIEIVRGFEDGRYVFLHVVQILNDGVNRYVTADIFDTDGDAKLIEHWDIIEKLVDETVSGHSQVDGPTEPTDLDKSDENKALVTGFIERVLIGGDRARLGDFISTESYTQHNPVIADGVEGLTDFLERLAAEGRPVAYRRIHRVVGCGSLVAVLSEAAIGDTGIAVIDLFRVAEGRIVEHWDVTEEIQPEETWVNSGKF